MKVLHLAKHLNTGGITTYLTSLSKGLLKKGFEITIVSSGGEAEEALTALGVRCLQLDLLTKSELSWKLYRAIGPVTQLVRAERFDVLHAHTRVTQVLGQIVSLRTGVPLVTTCHGFYKRRLGRRLFPAWGRKVIAISPSVETHLATYFKVKRERIETVPNSIDVAGLCQCYSRYDPQKVRQELGLALDAPVLGIVARIVKDKGHVFLLHAAKVLKPDFPKLTILIVGEGNFKSEVQKEAARLGLEKDVLFYGNALDVTRPLCALDVFVLPVLWREGFGLSVVEAMAVGKPVIVSNRGALNTIIQHERNGLLVKASDVDFLAQAIRRLLTDRPLRDRLVAQARRDAEERYSVERMVDSVARIYEQVVR